MEKRLFDLWPDILSWPIANPPDREAIKWFTACDDTAFLDLWQRSITFWQKMAHIPQMVELEFNDWNEMTGVLYDMGIIIKDGQSFFGEQFTFHHLTTLAGNLVGYAFVSDSDPQYHPCARLDARLELG